MLRNLIKRKEFLINENSLEMRKKINVDLFDIRFMPLEYEED